VSVITHRNQYKIHFRMVKLSRGTNVCHTRAIVTILPEFLYKWMPLYLVYTIAMLLCEEALRGPYKVSDQVEFGMRKWSENDIIAIALYLHCRGELRQAMYSYPWLFPVEHINSIPVYMYRTCNGYLCLSFVSSLSYDSWNKCFGHNFVDTQS
jgi:hypothetical protein